MQYVGIYRVHAGTWSKIRKVNNKTERRPRQENRLLVVSFSLFLSGVFLRALIAFPSGV